MLFRPASWHHHPLQYIHHYTLHGASHRCVSDDKGAMVWLWAPGVKGSVLPGARKSCASVVCEEKLCSSSVREKVVLQKYYLVYPVCV